METKTIEVSAAQAQLSELLSLVAEGTEIILTDGERPLARIVQISEPQLDGSPKQRIAGLHAYAGAAWTSDDFDAELPDEFWLGTS